MASKSAKAYAANNVETGVSAADSSQLIVLVYERLFDHLKLVKTNSRQDGMGSSRLLKPMI